MNNRNDGNAIGNFSDWIKDNLVSIAIVVFALGYVASGLFGITQTGKTIDEILFDGIKSLIGSLVITNGLKILGIQNGKRSPQFVSTMNAYADTIEQCESSLDGLDKWCDKWNDENLRRIQRNILLSAGLSYERWQSPDFTPRNKAERIAVKKAENVRPDLISATILLSDADNITEGKLFGKSIGEFMSKKVSSDALITIFMTIVFAYFSVGLVDGATIAGALYSLFQVATFFVAGAIQYLFSYMFVTGDYRQRIIVKINLLKKYISAIKENDNGKE